MRKGYQFLWLALFIIIAASFVLPQSVHAVPAFARQTSMGCTTCHFQHFPALNAFGRAFKAGGYTMIGGESMIEGDMLSLPSVLNASVILKARYQKTNGDYYFTKPDGSDPSFDEDDTSGRTVKTSGKISTNKGEFQLPDEASLFLGGRVGEHVGFMVEGQIADPDSPLLASFKMPIVHEVGSTKISIIPFTTDSLGASFGFELLNTGAVLNIRPLEPELNVSAQQYVGTGTPAEGIALVAANNMGFVNYSLWAPSHTAKDIGPASHYVRVAATPYFAGWDFGGGVQWWGGTTKIGSDAVTTGGFDADHPDREYKTHAWAIDAQAQGVINPMPLGVYISYGNSEKSDGGKPENYFNSNPNNKTALAIVAELGVLPGKATVALGYRVADTGEVSNSKDNSLLFAATYKLVQNVRLELNHSIYSGSKYDTKPVDGDQLTTLLLFAGF